MADALLSLDRVTVAYGTVQAVRNVSLTIPKGAIVTVIGANGAGKSTLLNAIMGLLPATGAIVLAGADQGDREVEARVQSGMSLVPEKRELFSTMSVEDNLKLGAYRFSTAAMTSGLKAVYDRFPRLKERRAQAAGTLSGGERQMLAMGRALMGTPQILMLDEPSLGLAPLIVKDIFAIVSQLRQAGVSILLVEQNARAALQVADYAYVMELGQIAIEGQASDLAQDKRVIESYLGLGGGH